MVPIWNACVQLGPIPPVIDPEMIECCEEVDSHPPCLLTYKISITRNMERITANRSVTIRELFYVFVSPGCNINIERLLQVFREVRVISINSDTPAQQLGPLLKFEPLSPEIIDKSKPPLCRDEKKVLTNLMEFMVQNNWCIPWMEVSTGRFVGIEQLLYSAVQEAEPLIDKDVRNYYFPVVVLHVVNSKLQEGTVNSIPMLLPSTESELKSIAEDYANVSICMHIARADGSVRRSSVKNVSAFNERWLRQWRKNYPRFQHVYLQFVTEHTDDFPLETVTFDYPASFCTHLRYMPKDSVYTESDNGAMSHGPLDIFVPVGSTMFELQGNWDLITALEHSRCIRHLEDAFGKTRWMTICQRDIIACA